MKYKRTRSSRPQVGGSWQISGFHMKEKAEIFSICFIYNFMKPLKIWAHLDNFYFHCFIGVTKWKNSKKQWIVSADILNFFLWSPPWNNENKSCLNELKFWEASENHKLSICWKFQLSISCGTQKSAKIPLLWPRWFGPFDVYPGLQQKSKCA